MANIKTFKKSTQELLNNSTVAQKPRPYLGMSGAGEPCKRKLWMGWRWFKSEEITTRKERLFRRGHREEPDIIYELEKIGVVCDAEQQEIVALHGHAKGHNDGSCINVLEAPKTPHMLEFKTMSQSAYNDLVKKGSCEKYSLVYYTQVQLYMHFLELTRTLWIAVCKNTDHYFVERIHYDRVFAESAINDLQKVLLSESAPSIPPGYSPTFYKCKISWCQFANICHKKKTEDIDKSCRSCKYSEPEQEGKWFCNKFNNSIPQDFQYKGCDSYKLMNVYDEEI